MLLVLMLDCTVFKTLLPSILLQLRNLIVWCGFFSFRFSLPAIMKEQTYGWYPSQKDVYKDRRMGAPNAYRTYITFITLSRLYYKILGI